jgi:chorismate-pyruvate lyase
MLGSLSHPPSRAAEPGSARRRPRHLMKAIVMLGLCGTMIQGDAVVARPASSWPDTRLARAEVESLIDSFQARLLAAQTATAALDAWCAEHKLAPVLAIRARIVLGVDTPLTKEQRERLRIGEAEPIKYRRVELTCGDHVLSEADNWYVPGRLTADMNGTVETTDTPFGRAVAGLRPYRKTFSVTRLWEPTPAPASSPGMIPGPGIEASPEEPARPLDIPWHLLEHRALVFSGDGVPFAEVRETYTRNILGLAAP